MSIFDYKVEEAVGSVYTVDTGTVLIAVSDAKQLRTLQVNHLVVLRSSKAGQHLLGLINKITRKSVGEQIIDDDENSTEEGVIVENVIRVSLIGTMLDFVGAKPNVFRRTLETVPEIDAPCFVLDGDKLTQFMKSISSGMNQDNPLKIGKYTIDEDAVAWLDGNKFFQRHAVIVGSTGSGKSWTVARVIEQVAELDNPNAVVFDIHGEYKPIKGKGIQHLKIAGPGDLDGKKGLSDGILFLPYWMLSYEEILVMILDRSDSNAPNQAMLFSREITKAKRDQLEKDKRKDILANFTIDSPIPYSLDDVLTVLNDLDTEVVPGAKSGTKKGDFNGKLSRFIQRLEAKRQDRRMGFLFASGVDEMRYEWMHEFSEKLIGVKNGGVKIIDFSEVPSDILPLIISLVARIIFSIQQWTVTDKRHPIALICEEAHLYIPIRSNAGSVATIALNSFERIAKEGRKYGVSLIIVSQRPSEVNRTVLSQCSNYIAMRLTNAEDQQVVKRLLPDNLGNFSELLPILDIGEALIVGDASILPSRVRIDIPTQKPSSSTVAFWDEWSKKKVESGVTSAVEALRKQSKVTAVAPLPPPPA